MCKLLEDSKQLVNFDISWAEFPTGMFKDVLQAISKNRRISYANLSWNSMSEAEERPNAQEKPTTKRLSVSSIKFSAPVVSFEIECICKFVKYNKNLLHLNLQNMGINEPMLDQLMTSIKKAKSLQSIHLSNNPCFIGKKAKNIIEKIRENIRAKNEYNSYV